MTQPGTASPEWSRLQDDIRQLEIRITEIERLLEGTRTVTPARAVPAQQNGPAMPAPLAEIEAAPLLPLVGRALLGLAGAYLLRALTEAGVLHPGAGVAAGFAYAILWLVWAARTPAEKRIETALHSVTSVLVLSPLLWEAVLRFHVVSNWTAGGILLFFTVFGLSISWRKNLLVVATIATLAGLGTAAGLLVATKDVLPFTFVFLGTAAAVEASACLDHWLSERWLAAAAADISVLLATWLVTNPRGLPESYAPIPHGWLLVAQAGLLAIYLSSTIVRTLLRGFTFTPFETAQCAAALLIGVGGGLRLSHQAPAIAGLSLACAAACYTVAFVRLDHGDSPARNFFTYSTFGLLLAMAGSLLLLSGTAAAILWWGLAIAFMWAGGFYGRLTLQVHAGVYLLVGLFLCGALGRAAVHLLGVDPGGGDPMMLWAGAPVALACYALATRYAASREGWAVEVFRLVVAGTLVWLAAGVLASALTGAYHAALGSQATHAYCATLRTAVFASAALALAWVGTRWRARDLSRLVYPLMAIGGYRLLTQDLHQERQAALFLSLFVYGLALTALPRLSRARPSNPAQVA